METVWLNPVLVKQQELTGKDILKLTHLHNLKDELFKTANMLDPEEYPELQMLRYLSGALECIEYAMQTTWRFEQTNLKHTWWCQLPGCECTPDYDGRGFPQRTSPGCRIHT